MDVRGVERVDDRRVISGIVHVLKSGCRWCDCPPDYGPPTTIYNRFVRWARRGVWENLFRELAGSGRSIDTQMIDSTHVKAHRWAAGGKGGSRSRLLGARVEGATRRFTHSHSPLLLYGGFCTLASPKLNFMSTRMKKMCAQYFGSWNPVWNARRRR